MPCTIKTYLADDGKTQLLSARFRREALFDDGEPLVEIIWELFWPDGFNAPEGQVCLDTLSTTRVDTRQPITLTRVEIVNAREEALDHAAGEAEDW